jgi:hypothetical protein
MSNFTAVQMLMRELDNTSDEALVFMCPQWAEVLRQSGNSSAAAYILSLPRDTLRFTAREIRNTVIQQAKVNLSPQYTQIEVCKRRSDGYGALCMELSAELSSPKRSTSTKLGF